MRFFAAPGALAPVAEELIPALTFGLVQVESFAPLKLGVPDSRSLRRAWRSGFAVERMAAATRGQAGG